MSELEINVKEFGAIGDGTNDDTISIQAAINCIDKNNGGKVIFPKGKYLVSSVLKISDNILIQGK